MGNFNGLHFPRSAKVQHVLDARAHGNTGKHSCHWPGCKVKVPPAMFACGRHWKMLPQPIQRAIWRAYQPGQEDTKTPSSAYIAAARAAQDWIRENHPPQGEQRMLL